FLARAPAGRRSTASWRMLLAIGSTLWRLPPSTAWPVRFAISWKPFDEFNRLGVEFISVRENIDSAGALGRAVFVIVGAVAQLERDLIRERVRSGMRRARLEGRRLGRRPLELDNPAILADRARGLSLGQLAKLHQASRTTIRRVLAAVPKGVPQAGSQVPENRRPETAA